MQFRNLMERTAFGVCSYVGGKISIAASRVRIYFIYLSFVTLGSSVILYLFAWFWMNIRQYLRRGSSVQWD
ncbi:MAG: PspC family transcriptional regulator [Saprospiraceae bacterium]|nr:PspC family transcriptional regulator [Saprospiraceae bacterium]